MSQTANCVPSSAPTSTAQPCIGVIVRANRSIGTGHLMRIKPLLPKLKAYARLHLFVYAFDENLRPLCAEYDEIKTFATKDDVLTCLLAQPDEALPQVLIIDDYAIDARFEEPLARRAKIMVVDDLYDRPHYCDLLLDQNLRPNAAAYQKLCPEHCQLLLGARYSLTAERFYPQNYQLAQPSCNCCAHSNALSVRALIGQDLTRPLPPVVNAAQFAPDELKAQLAAAGIDLKASATVPVRVFVNFGGADPVSACLTFTQALLQGRLYERYAFTVVAGASNNDYPQLQEQLAQIPPEYAERVHLLRHCNDVADLLFKHDIAIGAYGGMFRERLAAGIPTIGVAIADNQQGGPAAFKQFRFGLDLSLAQLGDAAVVAQTMAELIAHAPEFTHNCLQVYDGNGLERIAAAVVALLPQENLPHA